MLLEDHLHISLVRRRSALPIWPPRNFVFGTWPIAKNRTAAGIVRSAFALRSWTVTPSSRSWRS